MKLEDFVDSRGRSLPKEMKDDLTEAIVRTIAHPDADVPTVVKRAQAIARRAIDGEIRDLLHYATKALSAVSRKQQRLAKRSILSSKAPNRMIDLAGATGEGSPDFIESRILIEELLSHLSSLEREVFVRHTTGWDHSAIGKELGISVAMSSYYLLRAKARLDKARKARR